MKLLLKPVTDSDLAASTKFYNDATTGHLNVPILEAYWPVPADDDAGLRARTEWITQRQRELLANDPTIRFMQVVDEETSEPVAFAQWHDYKDGFRRPGNLEITGTLDQNDAATWPAGLSRDEWLKCWEDAYATRENSSMVDHHCWVLTTLITRKPLRRQGAAGMILQWGIDQARAAGVPAYLEAAQSAKSLYEKHGFEDLGSFELATRSGKFLLSRMCNPCK